MDIKGKYFVTKNRPLMCLVFAFFVVFEGFNTEVKAADAPVITTGVITNAVPGTSSVPMPCIVTGFTNIGSFTITMRFDTTRVRYVSATMNSSLSGMTVTYIHPSGNTQGYLIFNWTGIANVSLTDGSHLVDLSFNYVTGSGLLRWDYTIGNICKYYSWVNGSLTQLTDIPKYLFYKNGGIANRSAPITYAPVITNPSVGALAVPITIDGCTDISAVYLNLEYDPTILTFINGVGDAAFTGSFLVNSVNGQNGKRLIIISWYGGPVTLSNGSILCTLNFTYSTTNGTYTALTWYDTGPSCEYADVNGDVLLDFPTSTYYINGSVGQQGGTTSLLNINLAKDANCGGFTVKLTPVSNLQNNLTKVIFTVTWPAVTGSDLQLTNITATWPGLAQVGSRVLYNGNYYVTFTSMTSWAVNWAATTDNLIMSFRISGDGEGTANFTIIATDYSVSPPGVNTAYYAEVATVVKTNNILNNANSTSLNCRICLQDFLQGAYSTVTHLMRTDLKTAGLIPLSHPYSTAPWSYSGTESVAAIPANVVDWVLVELRTGTAAATVVARRAGFIKNDGNIVDLDGTTALVFYTFVPGNSYYVVVYHRNHFPVMTATAMSLPNTVSTKHNFTISPASNVYSTTNDGVILLETGIFGQISGEINHDNKLKCSGSNNDRGLIIAKINAVYTPPPANLTSTISGYYAEDLNMNGIVKYSGSQNDQGIIFSNIDALTPSTIWTSIYQGQVPISYTVISGSPTINISNKTQ